MKRIVLICLSSFWLSLAGWSQSTLDSLPPLLPDQFFFLVLKYHPIAGQAQLLDDEGRMTLRSARGGFDPYLFSKFKNKNYSDTEYYSLFNSGLSVPTWFGVEVMAGYDRALGQFVNPENNVPADGLGYLGVSVPVGAGLFIDQRRATLRQAQIFQQSNAAEQRMVINDLLLEAAKAYYNWVLHFNNYLVFENGVSLAQFRFEGVKNNFEQGANAGIDTLEALIQVQNRTIDRDQALLDYRNAGLELSNYLWSENQTPLVLNDSIRSPYLGELEIAEPVQKDSLENIRESMLSVHPQLLMLDFKLKDLNIERRFKTEMLKPQLDFNYNLLTTKDYNMESLSGNPVFSTKDYKWGFDFSIPIPLRGKRGELGLTKVKISDTELKLDLKQLELNNKLDFYYNSMSNLYSLMNTSSSNVINYEALLAGENEKFRLGSSSLFLVNSRESKLLDSQTKLIKFQTSYLKSLAELYWSSGLINQ